MKGGILLALRHDGDRYTRDIDFSTKLTPREIDVDSVLAELAAALAVAVTSLPYGLDCRIQAHELRPASPASSWPTLTIRVGYAPQLDRRRQRRLLNRQAIDVVSVDLSYNEVITAAEIVDIAGGSTVQVSDLSDLLAEKFRAMLQQTVRRRTRRQDTYDIYRLLGQPQVRTDSVRATVLSALREKSASRNLLVDRESLRDVDIQTRSRAEYHLLAGEISSELPDFEHAYTAVRDYYESLPWG